MNNSNHSNILIIGGGCAGISVATRLKSLKSDLTISFDSVISFADPSSNFGLNYQFNKSINKNLKENIKMIYLVINVLLDV